MKVISIEYTETFERQISAYSQYLARYVGTSQARSLIFSFIETLEKRVTQYPESSPLCEEASDLGFTNYRDFILPAQQLRAIYRLEDEKAYMMLFLKSRQSIREALVQYCLRIE